MLTSLAKGSIRLRYWCGRWTGSSPEAVFVFPGQGSQWLGMATDLIDTSPAFAASMQECANALAPHIDWNLHHALRGHPDAPSLERVDVVQPALWAVMISLTRLWETLGIHPTAVIGHSQGEIAAAHIAGILTLDDSARIVALRSQLIAQHLAGHGTMASTALNADTLNEQYLPHHPDIGIAAHNSPHNTILSGPTQALDHLLDQLENDGIRIRRIPVDYASHHPHVETLHTHLTQALAPITPQPGHIPFHSTVTTTPLDHTHLTPDYWYQNLRNPVLFHPTIEKLLNTGHTTYIEPSPHPALTTPIQQTAETTQTPTPTLTLPTLHRNKGTLTHLLTNTAQAWTHGLPVNWTTLYTHTNPQRTPLPTYPFDRRHYWLDAPWDSHSAAAPASSGGFGADSDFWDAVENEDLNSLSEMLSLGDQEPQDSHGILRPALPLLSGWRREQQTRTAIDSWRYQISWRPHTIGSALSRTGSPAVSGSWLVITPAGLADHPWAVASARALGDAGAQVSRISANAGTTSYRESFVRLLEAAAEAQRDGEPPAGILSLLALSDDATEAWQQHPQDSLAGAAATLGLVQAIVDVGLSVPLWCATSGAVSVGRADRIRHVNQAHVWGLGQVAGLEHPDWWGGLIDLPEEPDDRAVARLVHVLAGASRTVATGAASAEDQFALRSSGIFVRRLIRAAPSSAPRGPEGGAWSTDGPALITGGTGALGAHVARWLARSGTKHLVLTSRRGTEAPGADELKAELDELVGPDGRVEVRACDVADRAAVAALVASMDRAGTPVRAVFHTAGIGTSTPLADTDGEALTQACTAKSLGARHLDDTFQDRELDAFVLFSSGAGVWGGGGQGAYAAANSYLDALSQHRRSRGPHALSVAWGTWGGGGMAAQGAAEERLRRMGLPAMAPALAVEALRQALDRDETTVTVANIDWGRFAPTLSAARHRPLISDLAEARAALDGGVPDSDASRGGTDGSQVATSQAGTRSGDLRQRLSALSAGERDRALLDLVRAEAAAVLGHPGEDSVAPHRAFKDLGFDSLTAVQLRNRLTSATGLLLPTTLVFDHPSPLSLVTHLKKELLGVDAAAGARAEHESSRRGTRTPAAGDDDPLVIVSMSCRFPGAANSPEQLWELIAEGRDAVSEFPADRGWDLDRLYDPELNRPGTSYAREGAFVDNVAEFDAALFGISPREALAMDPQQRLLLETRGRPSSVRHRRR